MARLLVVEDQVKLRRNLQEMLERDDHQVATAGTGAEGLAYAMSQKVDAVVLDLSLPDRDGLTVLSELRSGGFDRPVLILTTRDGVEDRAAGLDQGADDYLVKPFAQVELLARVRALLSAAEPLPPRGCNLAEILDAMQNTPLKQLEEAIQAEDHEKFVAAYKFSPRNVLRVP